MKQEPINKEKLKGKYIQYTDKDEKTKVGKVTKIKGNFLTIKNCLDQKERVHLEKVKGMVWNKNKLRPIK